MVYDESLSSIQQLWDLIFSSCCLADDWTDTEARSTVTDMTSPIVMAADTLSEEEKKRRGKKKFPGK